MPYHCHASRFSRKTIPSRVIIWCPPTIHMYVYISGNQYTYRCTHTRWLRMGCDDGACLKFIPWLDPTKTLCPQVFMWILSLPDHQMSHDGAITLQGYSLKSQHGNHRNSSAPVVNKNHFSIVPIAVPNICTKHIKEVMCSMTSSYLWHPAKLTSVCSIQ